MKEHSIKAQSIAKPVWLVVRPSLIPLFMITPKHKRKSEHLPHYYAKARNGAKLLQHNVL